MKQTNLQTKGENPKGYAFKTFTDTYSTLSGLQSCSGTTGIISDQYFGKDPPYRKPRPGTGWCLIPDN